MNLTGWYKRWRHGRGFGVHSPSAYRLVREVLRLDPSYGFYAYADISRASHWRPSLISIPELEMIYRLLVDFRPASVAIYADESRSILEAVVSLALPSAKIVADGGEFAIVEGKYQADSLLGEPCPKQVYFTYSKNPLLEQLWARAERGHLFRNPSRALLQLDDRLPRECFEIRF